MADPVVPVETPTPPPEPPAPSPPPAVEATDEHGVPWKNRAAENARKLQEQIDLNQQYQQALGRVSQPQPQQPTQGKYAYEINGEKYELDAPTAEIVKKIAAEVANQTAYQFVGRAQMQQEASDPEVQGLARTIYQNEVLQDPYKVQWNDDARQGWAIKEAQLRLFKQKQAASSQQSSAAALQAAAAAQAAGASIPGTHPGNQPVSTDKDKFIREFMSDSKNRGDFKKFYQTDPDSEEGKKRFLRAAEEAWKGIDFGPTVATAVHVLSGGR
jgi:hypothetical protein